MKATLPFDKSQLFSKMNDTFAKDTQVQLVLGKCFLQCNSFNNTAIYLSLSIQVAEWTVLRKYTVYMFSLNLIFDILTPCFSLDHLILLICYIRWNKGMSRKWWRDANIKKFFLQICRKWSWNKNKLASEKSSQIMRNKRKKYLKNINPIFISANSH